MPVNALEAYRKTNNPGGANLSVSRKGLSDLAYSQASQQANTDAWTAQGIDPSTGRKIATPGSGQRAAITKNVREKGTADSAAGTWIAGGNDPLDDLRQSAASRGRMNGLYTPKTTDYFTGEETPGVNVWNTSGLDGSRSGLEKIAAYNNAWQESPNYSPGASYQPKTQAELDSLDEGGLQVNAPQYYNDVRSNEFFEKYGQMFGPDESAPSVNYGYLNETARGQETASYQNRLVFDKWKEGGRNEPQIQNRYSDDGGWIGVELSASSGNDALDQAYMQRARAAQGKGISPQIAQRYEGGISSAMQRDLGYDTDVSNDIWSRSNKYREGLDSSARTALAGIANAGDIGQNMTTWDLRRMQQEGQRDELLKLAKEKYDTDTGARKSEADTLKEKNADDVNRLMEERIAELKRTGRVVVGPDGEYTTGSQQLMDKIRSDFRSKLDSMNGDIDTRLDQNLAGFSSELTSAQQAAHSGYYDYFDESVLQQQKYDDENSLANKEAEIEQASNLLEMKGFDSDRASKLSIMYERYTKMNKEEIDMAKGAIKDLYYEMNGVEAPEGFIEQMQDNADAKEAEAKLAKAEKSEAIVQDYPLTQVQRNWLTQKGNEKFLAGYLSKTNRAQAYSAIQQWTSGMTEAPKQESSRWSWFGGDDEQEYNTQDTSAPYTGTDSLESDLDSLGDWAE